MNKPWEDLTSSTSQPCEELLPTLMNTFLILQASSERGPFKILPKYGASAGRPIGLDRIVLGLVREEGQIVDQGNRKRSVFILNPRICLILVWTTKLQVGIPCI